MRFRASDVAAATGGTVHGPDVAIDGVSFDSRTIAAGQLFVPLVAERDGHDFIGDALARGAAAYLTRLGHEGGTCIDVDDTLVALMDLARARRWHYNGTVIGITGSVGKTSTKDFAAAALATGRRTWANERSFNNDFGLPATMLNAPEGTEVMILEMGMRGFGEIERLCGIAQPHIGVVTRVAEAHSDRVGGIEGVAIAKAELVRSLPASGTAILNGDDERVRRMAELTDATPLTFGRADHCDVRITDVVVDATARPSCTVSSPWGTVALHLAVAGEHMLHNAVAALACAGMLGCDLATAADAVQRTTLTARRMEVGHTATGALLIDDSYNANPTSMRAAIDALVALPAVRRVAMLGVMAEISDAAEEHRSIARYCAERGVELIVVGTDLYGQEAVDDPVAAAGSIAGGDAVLVKGSLVAGMGAVAAALRDAV
jgi:UDP-N-acetylmuramoyl-tripeptide--D-alanyl-D-alanine ligase